jgi:hypothetical protein
MFRTCSFLLILALAACGKKGASTSTGGGADSGTSDTGTTKSSVPDAPAEIPQKYNDILKQNWTKIEELGATFTEQFKKAQESRGRDKAAVDAASDTYRELADLWAEVTYAAQDESEEIQELWSNHLRSYERKVNNWTKMSKGLKEFSRVK